MTVLFVGASACALAALLIAEHREVRWGRFAKMLASTGFIAVALASGAVDSAYGQFVLVALGLSWVVPRPATFGAFRTSSDAPGCVLVLEAREVCLRPKSLPETPLSRSVRRQRHRPGHKATSF